MKALVLSIAILLPSLSLGQIPILDARKEITKLLDEWHVAAAEADSEKYFGSMSETCRYLGTDASERWTKAQFREFAKDAFEHKRTWKFVPSERKLKVEKGIKFAWFDELLDTWMGPCRGSGVLIKTEEGWKIDQYSVTILVPNDKVNSYLELIGLAKEE
ncbi:MAG: nuclear transport factor 2 family protein [Cyclobacteriaceae bacterium]